MGKRSRPYQLDHMNIVVGLQTSIYMVKNQLA